jgi:hypothetical protein
MRIYVHNKTRNSFHAAVCWTAIIASYTYLSAEAEKRDWQKPQFVRKKIAARNCRVDRRESHKCFLLIKSSPQLQPEDSNSSSTPGTRVHASPSQKDWQK